MHQNDKTGQRLRSMFNGHMLLNFKYIFCCCESSETTTRNHYIGAIFSNNKCAFVFVCQYLTIYKYYEYYEKIKPKHLQ